MQINMWSTGELKREIKVHETTVYMKITRPLDRTAMPVVIELNNAHVYYPQTTDEFFMYLPLYALFAEKLRLPDDMGTVHRLINYIQDGFDELLNKCPVEDDRYKQTVGEISATFGDIKISHEIQR